MNTQKAFLLVLVTSLLFLSALMLKPFLGWILGATLLAFILMPVHDRISKYIGQRISALTLIILSIVLVSVPFALIFGAVASDAQDAIGDINSTTIIDTSEVERVIFERTGQEVDLDSQIQDALSNFVNTTLGSASKALGIITSLSIGISVMLFLLYYLLKDGKKFAVYLKDTLPLPDEILDSLEDQTYITTWAVIKGHILVAIIQGSIAGIGLWLTGIPNYIFWTFVMILLAFIPIIGAFLVWGPASIYLFMIDRPIAAVILIAYGSIVVSFTDNFLRPILVEREADIHPAVILIGVIGGVYVFGAAGLFIGPIVFGVLKAATEVFKDHYNEL